jgi:hypothetical protein
VDFRSNDLLAPRESARGAVSHLFVKNKSGERTRRDAQLRVTAARSAAVTLGAERRPRRLHRGWAAEVTVRSSAWFGANCRLVYFIIDIHRQAPGQAQ